MRSHLHCCFIREDLTPFPLYSQAGNGDLQDNALSHGRLFPSTVHAGSLGTKGTIPVVLETWFSVSYARTGFIPSVRMSQTRQNYNVMVLHGS